MNSKKIRHKQGTAYAVCNYCTYPLIDVHFNGVCPACFLEQRDNLPFGALSKLRYVPYDCRAYPIRGEGLKIPHDYPRWQEYFNMEDENY